MGKRILFLILLTVLLVCPLVSGAETVTADSRIVALHSHFECGCDVMKDGASLFAYLQSLRKPAAVFASRGSPHTKSSDSRADFMLLSVISPPPG